MMGKTIIGFFLVAACFAYGQTTEEFDPFRRPVAPPPVDTAPPATTSLDGFQFNGMMKFGGKVRISVFDEKTQRNVWLTEGEVGEFGLTFQRFDSRNESVVIAQGGLSKKLSLNKVKIDALKIAPNRGNAAAAATATANQVTRPNAPAKVETDEEARARIQRVAEEIRRRRAERRKQLEERNRAEASR